MTFVAVNVLSVPPGRGDLLEQRFAARAGSVEKAPGFERFELLGPVEGTDAYLVYTRWSTREHFEAWTASQAFDRGHAQASGRSAEDGPAATGSTIWLFEVVQATGPA